MTKSAIAQPKSSTPTFSVRVKTALLAKGLTVTDLAAALGYRRNTVSLAIHGRRGGTAIRQRIKTHLNLR